MQQLSKSNIPLAAAVANTFGAGGVSGMGVPGQVAGAADLQQMAAVDPNERKKKLMAAVGGPPDQTGDRSISDAVLSLFKK